MPFFHPATIMLAGPTMCGKTQFLLRVLKEHMIFPFPERIVIVFGEEQPAYAELRLILPHTEFIPGPMDASLYESFRPDQRNLLVLDDQMVQASKSNDLTKYFVQGAHHRNLTIIFIVQNIFGTGKSMRNARLNTNYLVLFKNPSDNLQPSLIARQIFPSKWKRFIRAFEDALVPPYQHFLLDLRQDTPDQYRLRSCIFGEGPNGEWAGTDAYII